MGNPFFKDKTVWVIGASSGIGEEFANQLANSGARLILSARNEEKLNDLKKSLPNSEAHVVFPIDLEKVSGQVEELKTVIESWPKIDYLINNGGLSQRANAADTSVEIDKKVMEINYFGNITLTKLLLPQWKKNGGHVVVISSIAGKFGFFLRSAYSASKHALHGFYESLRLEEEDNNIHVTVACPGKINTPISTNAINASGDKHGVMDHNQETGMPVDECVRQILKAVQNRKREVLIGGKEIKAVTVKRFFPNLFHKIIRKQSAT